jgi:hypothetical protein
MTTVSLDARRTNAGLATLLLLAGALSACTNSSSKVSDTTVVREAPTSVVREAPSSVVREALTSEAATTAPTTITDNPFVIDANTPLTFSVPIQLGTGFFAGWANGTTAIIASETADSQLGCEGFPEVVLEAKTIAVEERYRITPTDPLRNGAILQRNSQAVQIDACEGFVTDISKITQDTKGIITEVQRVDVKDTDLGVLESAPSFTLSLDGTSLFTTWTEEGSNTAARIDLTTGAVTQILKDIDGGRQIEDATDGRIALSDGTTVRIVGADGTVQQSYDASSFDVSDDGTRIALIKDDQVWVTDVGEAVGKPAKVIQAKGGTVYLCPDNYTVAVVTSDFGDTEQPPTGWIVLVRGEGAQTAFGPDYILSAGWTLSGGLLGFDTGKGETKNVLALPVN